jgi:hypothetical protein
MRILGVVFILVGLLLCLTIFGAFVGIPLIIVGCILVVVGGRRKTVITNVINVANTPSGAIPAEQMAASINMLPRDSRAGLGYAEGRAPALVIPAAVQVGEPVQSGAAAYDATKWKALVEFDTEIADAAKKLEKYGQSYVDQLAAAYLALNDKEYLSTILQKITARAEQEV